METGEKREAQEMRETRGKETRGNEAGGNAKAVERISSHKDSPPGALRASREDRKGGSGKGRFKLENLAWLGVLGILGSLDVFHELLGLFRIFYLFFFLLLAGPAAIVFKHARGAVAGGRREGRPGGDAGDAEAAGGDAAGRARSAEAAKAHATFLVQGILGVTINPFGLVQSIAQTGGQVLALLRLRGRLPYPDTYRQVNRFSLPFRGRWAVVNGGVEPDTSHSWELIGQRYAYDFVIFDEEGLSYTGDGSKPENYYAFGQEMLAPADGRIAVVRDGVRDYPAPRPRSGRIDWLTRDFRGNHVVIDHGHGEFSFLTHLKKGSICVERGQEVQRGQPIGLCGNSGHSTEPHLHFHVQDHPNIFLAASLPVRFADFRVIDGKGGEVGRRTADRGGQKGMPAASHGDATPIDDRKSGEYTEGYITRGQMVEPITAGARSTAGREGTHR